MYVFNHHLHFPAQINTYPVNIFRFGFSEYYQYVAEESRSLYHNLSRRKNIQA